MIATKFIAAVALLALLSACVNSATLEPGDTVPPTSTATPTPEVARWPDASPVPPLPVISLVYRDGPRHGSPRNYCWHLKWGSRQAFNHYPAWAGITEYPETAPDGRVPVKIEANTAPGRLFAQVFNRNEGTARNKTRRLSTTDPVLDLSNLSPGTYRARMIGHWEEQKVSYEFGLNTPDTIRFNGGCFKTSMGYETPLTITSAADPIRTQGEPVNPFGCEFNKPVARVIMTLRHEGTGFYTEIFHIDSPGNELSFPLKKTVRSDRHDASELPPREYSRHAVALSEDGQSHEMSWAFEKIVVATEIDTRRVPR